MQYKINNQKWNKLVEKYAEKRDRLPGYRGPWIVFNINEEEEDIYGVGPYSLAEAFYEKDSGEWLSACYPPDKLSFQDFRDLANHNVGGHSGNITHYMDLHSLNHIICELLKERE